MIVSPAKARTGHFLYLFYNINSANIDFLTCTYYKRSTSGGIYIKTITELFFSSFFSVVAAQ